MCRLNFPLDQTGCEFDGSERISYLVRKSGGHLPERCKAILQLLLLVQLLHQSEILEEQRDSVNGSLIIFGEGNRIANRTDLPVAQSQIQLCAAGQILHLVRIVESLKQLLLVAKNRLHIYADIVLCFQLEDPNRDLVDGRNSPL